MYKRVTALAVLLLISAFGFGQSQPSFIPNIFPSAPNTASLGKYGDYEVNLFSGLPDISIPLYEIQSGDLKVPIALSYHPSGIRVTEVASWAGLGWSVSCGGQIRRKVQGGVDEDVNGYLTGKLRSTGNINTGTQDGMTYLSTVKKGQYDVEPDIYSYDFPGKSGKFFFDGTNNYAIALIPFSPIAVNSQIATNNLSFNITDEKGRYYSFGANAKESSTASSGSGSATTSWMLENMISENKDDTISFSYASSLGSIINDNWDVVSVSDNIMTYNGTGYYSADPGTASTSSFSSTTTEQKLQQVLFKNGKVTFELSASNREDGGGLASKSLAAVKVYNYDFKTSQYVLIKTVRFYQSYFISGTDATTKRLRLDSVKIFDKSDVAIQRYSFNYNTTVVLPKFNSKARDYWGYYNGKANSSLVPRMEVPYYPSGSGNQTVWIGSNILNGREPDTTSMQACVLKRIYYPSGGYTDFEFETNRYLDNQNKTIFAGGLRVKSIKSYDGFNNEPIVKSYEYLNARPNYYLSNYYFSFTNTNRGFKLDLPGYFGAVLMGTKRSRTFVSNPAIDIEPYDGTPVVYSYVKEYNGSNDDNNGYTTYTFRDHSDAIAASSAVKPVLNSYFYDRGLLIDKSIYKKKKDGSFTIVHKEKNNYTAFPQKIYNGVGLVVNKTLLSDESTSSSSTSDVDLGPGLSGTISSYNDSYSYLYSNYSINSDDNYIVSQTTIDYDVTDENKSVSKTINYTYGNLLHQQPTVIYSTNSKGEVVKTTQKYPADYIVSGNKTNQSVLDSMLSRNMQATVIEKWDTLSKAPGSNVVTGGVLSIYKRLANGAIVTDTVKELQIDKTISNFQQSSIVSGKLTYDARYKNAIVFDAYDNANNLLQFTPNSAPASSVIWDYATSLPVAQVKNARQADIAYTSFESTTGGNWTVPSTTRTIDAVTGSKCYQLTSGTITKSGLQSTKTYVLSYWTKNTSAFTITGTSGSAIKGDVVAGWTNYEHKITGVTSVSVGGTGLIDELRLYPQDAQMTTYTYDALIGVTSQCDPMNRIIYYEYDDFGRLKLIKDQDRNIVKTMNYNYSNQQNP